MVVARRFVVLLALMVWQGGFMFYGAGTLPIMRARLGPGPKRSQITQQVTRGMNLVGTLAILAMFYDVHASPLARKRGRWLSWFGMAAPHPLLVWLHFQMSQRMADPAFLQSDPAMFTPWHRVYLGVNVLQWVSGMVFAWQTILAWRAEDRESLEHG